MAYDLIGTIRHMLHPIHVRVMNMVARAVLQRADDSKRMQIVQLGVLADETVEDVERVQHYGFTSVPLEGAEAVVLFVGGNRDHALAVAVDDRRHRLKDLQPGEVAVYDRNGSRVALKANGDIEITPASGKLAVSGTDVQLAGSTESAVRGSTYREAEAQMNNALATQLAAAGAALSTAGADPALAGVASAAAASLATAGAALTSAATAPSTFEGGAAGYLSGTVKLE